MACTNCHGHCTNASNSTSESGSNVEVVTTEDDSADSDSGEVLLEVFDDEGIQPSYIRMKKLSRLWSRIINRYTVLKQFGAFNKCTRNL